jgi:hypothetical protein
MTYTITLCDSLFSDVLTSSIHLEATTSGGTVLCSQSNGLVTGGYGATLSFTPARQRFNIEINTAATSFAPLVLEDLNGNRHPQTINVVLLTMPAGSSGTRPSTTAQLQQFIRGQSWSDEEKGAVYATMRTLSYLKRRRLQKVSGVYLNRKDIESVLDRIGINPDLVVV